MCLLQCYNTSGRFTIILKMCLVSMVYEKYFFSEWHQLGYDYVYEVYKIDFQLQQIHEYQKIKDFTRCSMIIRP